MRSPVALKTLSVILFIFALGNTLATSSPRVERGAPEAALFRAMQSFRFPITGFTRSYWDFYRGLAITVGILMFALAVIAWQLAGIAKRHGREALPIALTLLLACTGMLVVGFEFLFAIPIAFSAMTVVGGDRRRAPTTSYRNGIHRPRPRLTAVTSAMRRPELDAKLLEFIDARAMAYQVVLLNDRGSDASNAVRSSLRSAVEDLGLDPDSDLVFLNESSWPTCDRKYPAATIYFGLSAANSETTHVLDDVLSSGITVFPLVASLANYRSAVPPTLYDINGVESTAADPECRCIVDLVLRELRLIRAKRSAFVSYKRTDSSQVAEQLYLALDDRKYDVFLDTHSVEAGQLFQSVLWDRLGDADVLILLNSPNAFTSTWVNQEVTRAQNLGLGVIQVVWPGQPLRPDMDLCVPVVLSHASFDADGRLFTTTLTAILNEVEAIRARSFAARRARVVVDLRAYAVAAGTVAHLQPDGTVDVQHGGRRIRVRPVVGHPESQLLHDTHDSCLDAGPDTVGAIVFDDLGLYPAKKAHLSWLNTYLPVRAVGVSELPAWLS